MASPVIAGVTRALRTAEHPWQDTGARANGMDRWLTERPTSPRHPVGDMVVGDRHALLGLIVNPDIWCGDAYPRTTARS